MPQRPGGGKRRPREPERTHQRLRHAVNAGQAATFWVAWAEWTAPMETDMFKPLICTALVLASGLAFAQDAGADREARRAEWQAKAEARFAEADKDRDGRLDKVEAQAFGDRLVRNFDRIDANRDGEIERSEMADARRHAAQGKRHQRMRTMHAYQRGLFKGMDDDGNGAISRAELGDKMPRWTENFAVIDADANGEISADELRRTARRCALNTAPSVRSAKVDVRGPRGGRWGRPAGFHEGIRSGSRR